MKYIIITSISFLILISLSCKDKGVDPQDNYPPGYQHDIPWLSLADSPWPMHNADPQATGRSKYLGPMNGIIDWEFVPVGVLGTGVTIDKDSTIYFVTAQNSPSGLNSLNQHGKLKWIYKMGHFENYVTPLITSDGGIIISNGLSNIYCINPDSTIRWEYKIDEVSQININESLNIDLDGNLYFVNKVNNTLYSISKDGKFNWSLSDERLKYPSNIPFRTAFSPDGKTLYLPGFSVTVLAVDIVNKNVKWSYGNTLCYALMVDSDGNVYAQVSNGLVALDKDGKLKWGYIVTPSDFGADASPTIDKQGNIYFATDTLYALDYTGKLRWKYGLNKICYAPIICDNNGNIFVGTAGGSVITIVAFNSNGNLLWTISDNSVFPAGSPAIDNDGKLIYPLYHRKVIAIK